MDGRDVPAVNQARTALGVEALCLGHQYSVISHP
jgi:hypothetical protein